jgi:hypothetical protein
MTHNASGYALHYGIAQNACTALHPNPHEMRLFTG